MIFVTVYRVDYVRRTKAAIGVIPERRRTERGDNLLGLLRVARRMFAATPQEAFQIAVR